ncbi:MAG: hypothetical protein H7X97_07165 [Opitutaceae bacterium]|nr:hypothetical protein [Verrucomicrobiales bacterium]
MNDPKSWENLLEKWEPRRPSDGLRARLFGRARSAAGERGPTPGLAAWLVPAALCGLLLVMMAGFGKQPIGMLRPAGTNSLLASIIWNGLTVSNRSSEVAIVPSVVLMTASSGVEWNVWRVATFEWTNPRQSSSSMPSFQLLKTNNLRRQP